MVLEEGVGKSWSACGGCTKDATLDGSGGTGLRLNFDVGGAILYFLVEEYDDLGDRGYRLGVSSLTIEGTCT